MAQHGVMLAEELDNDSLSNNAAATHAARGSGLIPAWAFVRGPGFARLSGASPHGDHVVAS